MPRLAWELLILTWVFFQICVCRGGSIAASWFAKATVTPRCAWIYLCTYNPWTYVKMQSIRTGIRLDMTQMTCLSRMDVKRFAGCSVEARNFSSDTALGIRQSGTHTRDLFLDTSTSVFVP